MSEPLLLGVDAGLTNVKAVAFDRAGTAVAGSSTDTPGRSPAPARDEQDHDDLWAATVAAIERDGEVVQSPDADFEFRAGDQLIVVGSRENHESFSAECA